MINNWIKLTEKAVKALKSEYSKDNRLLVNESELKSEIIKKIDNFNKPEYDGMIKSEIPWYETSKGIKKPKFYFDLLFLRKSRFELNFGNQAMRKKGFYYNDDALAVMLKFAKPGFNFQGIRKDIEKLSIFLDDTKNEADKNKAIFIVAATDDKLFEKVTKALVDAMSSLKKEHINRLTGFCFCRNKFKRIDNTL